MQTGVGNGSDMVRNWLGKWDLLDDEGVAQMGFVLCLVGGRSRLRKKIWRGDR